MGYFQSSFLEYRHRNDPFCLRPGLGIYVCNNHVLKRSANKMFSSEAMPRGTKYRWDNSLEIEICGSGTLLLLLLRRGISFR